MVDILKITKPIAGEAIASRCKLVIRGGKNPCVELEISSFAEVFGLSVPIPTPTPLLCILLLFTIHCVPFQYGVFPAFVPFDSKPIGP